MNLPDTDQQLGQTRFNPFLLALNPFSSNYFVCLWASDIERPALTPKLERRKPHRRAHSTMLVPAKQEEKGRLDKAGVTSGALATMIV